MRLKRLFPILIFVVSVAACSTEVPDNHWIKAVPEQTPAMILPSSDATVQSVLETEYIPFFDDISSSAIPLVSDLQNRTQVPLPIKAMLFFPSTANDWQPIWITEAPENFDQQLAKIFKQQFAQNYYQFNGQTIHKLHYENRIIFAVQMNQWLLVSESSLGLEEAIRSYLGTSPSIQLRQDQLEPSRLVLNTPYLDHWIKQLAQVMYRPMIKHQFKGTKPSVLQVSKVAQDSMQDLSIRGTIPLVPDKKTELIAALSTENSPVELDRYISSNAAAFALFRLQPRRIPGDVKNPTKLDSLLLNDPDLYDSIYQTLDSEFAMVSFAESGFLSEGENLWIRQLSQNNEFSSILLQLERDDYISRDDNAYYVQSKILARLLGSDLCGLHDFYLSNVYKGAVLSRRKGLTESVRSDRSRRRVIYYDENYMNIRTQFPEEPSGLVIANSDRFSDFIKPFLAPNNYANAITSKFDLLSMSMKRTTNGNSLSFKLNTYKEEKSNLPYEENWVFPINNADISGQPVLANIGGSSRDEIIFATTSGKVMALASDGTVVLETNTGTNEPTGPPVIYDWYGNNQTTIMIAAGNKIYAWNDAGELLPKFPMELNEQITTPLNVADITRDGIPEILVATADRKVHALDGRGQDLEGWPQTTNANLTHAPKFELVQNQWSIWAFAENGLHAWNPNGQLRSGYPKFVNAAFNGAPVFYEDHVLGNAADGNVYSIGTRSFFADSLNIYSPTREKETSGQSSSDSLMISAVNVSNTALTGSPSISNQTVKMDDGESVTENMILTQSNNGSVFLINTSGVLRFTQSMGQPSAPEFSPFIYDVDNDRVSEVVTLANFGRLYAWEINNGERNYNLPTTGMEHPVVVDLEGNGYNEIIAQTREGLRCWTLLR